MLYTKNLVLKTKVPSCASGISLHRQTIKSAKDQPSPKESLALYICHQREIRIVYRRLDHRMNLKAFRDQPLGERLRPTPADL